MSLDSPYRFELSSRRIPRVLAVVVGFLILSHLVLKTLHYRGVPVPWDLQLVFDMDEEPTVPTWYASMTILASAVLTAAIAGVRRRAGDRDARYWYGLTLGFAFMSMDEIAALHEMMNTFMDIEWTIPGAIASLVVGVVYLPFLRRLPRETARDLVISAVVYLAGVLGVEHLTGPDFFRYSMDTLPYAYVSGFEESLEKIGVVLLIRALLRYMATLQRSGPIRLGLDLRSEGTPRA